ncbi:hypothetical protein [Ollibium composti]|uniref:hypothetical protein n=1 Tax=Ollibium composti TaxID=2675109 RepID=UPI001454C28A|nr:hypothetical protein [Mesorhizobium composti]
MTTINDSFPTIEHEGSRFTFEHLAPTSVSLGGQGAEGADINIRISYQTHVFSRRHQGDSTVFALRDEAGVLRQFCEWRYENSLALPGICQRMVLHNYLTWESLDKNKASNLAVAGQILKSGMNDLIVYYLFPSRSDDHNVELVVKSAYQKEIDFRHIKRRYKVCQLIKKAHFQQIKVP